MNKKENTVIRDFRITADEKYPIIQDQLFESDFDKFIMDNSELKGGEV